MSIASPSLSRSSNTSPGQIAQKPDQIHQAAEKAHRTAQLSSEIFQKLNWQLDWCGSGQELSEQANLCRWLKTDGFFKSIPQIPLLTREQTAQRAENMLALIAKTQELEPRLRCALPQLEDFTKRQMLILSGKKEEVPLCRKVHDKCRECLALLAKIWGYNSASWLEEALPIIGYCKNRNRDQTVENRFPLCCPISEDLSAAQFERLEPTLLVIQCVCSRAILCGNEKSLATALSHAPEQMIKMQRYSSKKDEEWGFLHHVEQQIPLAICLVGSRRWSRLEFESFANYYGTSSAIHLQAISPAYDFAIEISDQRRQRMLALTSFKSASITQDQILQQLKQYGHDQIDCLKAIAIPPIQIETRMLFEICEEKLALFPFGMMGWRVLPRHPPSKLDPVILHQTMQKHIKRPEKSAFENLHQANSPFEAVSHLIFGRRGMSQEIKEFYMAFVNEADGCLKSKGDLMLDLEMLEAARSTLFVTDGINNRLDCFTTWVMISALTAHLFDVQLHLGCPIEVNHAEIWETLLDLESKLCGCGLEELTSEIDFAVQENQVNMSLILNSGAPGGGKLFLCEGATNYQPAMAPGQNCCFSGPPDRGGIETELKRGAGLRMSRDEVLVFLYYSSLH